MSSTNTRYFLDQDNDGHWYVVRREKSHVWDEWLDLPSDNPDAWEPPVGVAYPVGGSPTLVTFTNPRIDDE